MDNHEDHIICKNKYCKHWNKYGSKDCDLVYQDKYLYPVNGYGRMECKQFKRKESK